MKILHITDYLMPKMGYQDFLLAKWNKKQNNDTYIITSNKYFPVPNYNSTWKKFLGPREIRTGWSIIDGVKILRKKIYFEVNSRVWISNLENEIINIKPDIIMVHNTASFSSLRVAMLCKRNNIPCMFDNHMLYSVVSNSLIGKLYYFIVKNFLSVFLSKVAYKIIGVTSETCHYLEHKEGYAKHKIFHLPLGIDHEFFYPRRNNKFNKKNKEFKIVQTGKLNEDKKPQWTAKAVLELLEKGEKISLEFIGGGSKKIISQIKSDFKSKKFHKKIKFTNFQYKNDLRKSYNNNDLFIFPEGASLSALEVAACRKPVIMADYFVSKSRVKLGIGITYKTGNIEDLKKKILSLTNNKKFYYKLCNKSYNGVIQNFTYSEISKTFIKLCKKAIKKSKSDKLFK